MGRSRRFRVSYVTGDGNRALARSDINSRIKNERNNEPPRKISPETLHKLKIVIERNKYTAKCFDCDFKVESNSGFLPILFDAEDHGQITQLDCPSEHKAVVLSWIRSIRKGWVTRDF